MKKFENFTTDDLQQFRKEIKLNSLFVSDYQNSFGISEQSASDFFDSYMDYLFEIASENGDSVGFPNYGNLTYDQFFNKYDTIDNLESWYGCYESFDWVEYIEEENELDNAA